MELYVLDFKVKESHAFENFNQIVIQQSHQNVRYNENLILSTDTFLIDTFKCVSIVSELQKNQVFVLFFNVS